MGLPQVGTSIIAI